MASSIVLSPISATATSKVDAKKISIMLSGSGS
jgi:hypothetical protein